MDKDKNSARCPPPTDCLHTTLDDCFEMFTQQEEVVVYIFCYFKNYLQHRADWLVSGTLSYLLVASLKYLTKITQSCLKSNFQFIAGYFWILQLEACSMKHILIIFFGDWDFRVTVFLKSNVKMVQDGAIVTPLNINTKSFAIYGIVSVPVTHNWV